MIHHHRFSTELAADQPGLSVLVDNQTGAVVAAGFCTAEQIYRRLPVGRRSGLVEVDDLGSAHGPIQAYLDGDLAAMGEVVVDQDGTEMQQAVWSALRAIPAGETRTYTELAVEVGRPKAVRAAGTACGRNLVAPFVPCHRALRSDGSLGGYYYGLEVKRRLLAHELA